MEVDHQVEHNGFQDAIGLQNMFLGHHHKYHFNILNCDKAVQMSR